MPETTGEQDMTEILREAALDYHRYPTPGKISVTPTKAMATARDLSLAYSPASPTPAWRSPTIRAKPAT
jgi:malic enzyme